MPSPFPGMDPWLENPEDFPGIHDTLITYFMESLNASLPDRYIARSARRVWVEEERPRIPDVGVHELTPLTASSLKSNWEAAMADAGMIAVEMPFQADFQEEHFLEIREGRTNRLVTAIEVLSPTNKATGERGRQAYLQKQAEYRAGYVNVLEIDLLRAGRHTTMVPETSLRQLEPDVAYHFCVTIPGAPRPHYVAAIRLDQRLPNALVPLRDTDIPVSVPVQELLNRAYANGRFAQSIDYAEPPVPPLTPAQAEWAGQLLRAAGKI